MVHYLDDFLFSGQVGTGQGTHLLGEIHCLVKELGVPLAHEKTVGPFPVLTFLRVEIDTLLEASRLPFEKVQKLGDMVESALSKRKLTLADIPQLLEHLNFACKGWAFLRRYDVSSLI